MNPAGESFDPVATEYDFIATLCSHNQFFLENLSTCKRAALDIGCGSGVLAFDLAKHYEAVVGIDIAQEMLAIAHQKRQASNIEYLYMDANQLALERKFDLITSRATLHHLHDLSFTLQTLKDLLNPAGKLVLLDNVSEVETPATIGYIVGAVRDFLPDCITYGLPNALRLFRFRTSEPWLQHLASDRYLSKQQFKAVYGHCLPNCSFTRLGCFMGVTWEHP